MARHIDTGISKMLQEIRQKYYYPGIGKRVKKWVEVCETCAKDKRVPNNVIAPEIINEATASEATACNVAKVIIDIRTKHSYLPTTLITNKGSAFTSTIVAKIFQILGITLKCATTKHPQTIGKLERTHASLKTNLNMASGEYRRQWHNYLPLAVLYHSSIGCEPSKVFMGESPITS